MTLPVVQFCFAVARGDTDCVRQLLPVISDEELFQEHDVGMSPALFCFLAASHARLKESDIPFNKLCELFPAESHQYRRPTLLDASNVQRASHLAISAIKSKLTTFLGALVPYMDMAPDLLNNPKKELTLTACMAALRLILEDCALAESKRTMAKTMLNKISTFRPSPSIPPPSTLEIALTEHRAYLPIASALRARSTRCSSQLEKRLDGHSHTLRQRIK